MTRKHCLSMNLRRLASMITIAILAGPANANVDLRVESRPMAGPIEALVRVTVGGEPATALTRGDFAVTLDGQSVNAFTLGLPAGQDPTQRASVVFVINSFDVGHEFRDAVAHMINDQMAPGDYAAIVRLRQTNMPPFVSAVVQPFMPIDGSTGTALLNDFLATNHPFSPRCPIDFTRCTPGRPSLDPLIWSIDQFANPPQALPGGAKAIVLIGSTFRYSRASQSDIVALANQISLPVSPISVGGTTGDPIEAAQRASLAQDTGGIHINVTDLSRIGDALDAFASMVSDAYPLTIPQAAVTDCNPHMLEVSVAGQLAGVEFTRCDTTPNPFDFGHTLDVAPATIVVSQSVPMTGIESPVAISVVDGEYSIGCSPNFTSAPGFILPDEDVCVRHMAANDMDATSSTVLIVGGVGGRFYSTTLFTPPPPPPPDDDGGSAGGGGDGGGGGGGATGLLELLLGLAALIARKYVLTDKRREFTRIARLFTVPQPFVLLATAAFFTSPARAGIDLRVESQPQTNPIEAYVRVTDGSGSVAGLDAADFTVTLDGASLDTFTFGRPPDQDPAQRISVVFVLNNGFFADPIQDAVKDFINQMAVGDYAAIVKTRYSIDPDLNIQLVLPFGQIDGSTNTNSLIDFVSVESRSGFPKALSSLMLAVEQFATPQLGLPAGPKAIILIGSGRDDLSPQSMSDVVAAVTEMGIPVFTIEIGDNSSFPQATARMASLATASGGTHFDAPDAGSIAEAYGKVASLLNRAYRLAIPPTAVSDCNPHMLEVTAHGQSASTEFTRCDSTPQNFHFPDRAGVPPGAIVVSDRVAITGIESPVPIAVYDGQYSIGCGSTFTSGPGFILPESAVCVRHTASTEPGTANSTTLIVGGVSSLFWSSTSAAPPPPPPRVGGGGGATGLMELLFALGASFARARWPKSDVLPATGPQS